MAHECPECGQVCYCGRDIDDCLFNFEEDVMRCNHWKQCEQEDDEDIVYFDNKEKGIKEV